MLSNAIGLATVAVYFSKIRTPNSRAMRRSVEWAKRIVSIDNIARIAKSGKWADRASAACNFLVKPGPPEGITRGPGVAREPTIHWPAGGRT
jgi:hypothetical protein